MTNDLSENTGPSTSTSYRPHWDQVWMTVAHTIAQRSKCSRAAVGCVLVDDDQNVLAASYNGPPPRYDKAEGKCIHWCPRAQGVGELSNDYSNCPSNHAEINALSRMTGVGRPVTAYITRLCCSSCAKALASAKLSRIVCQSTDIDTHLNANSIADLLWDSGVELDWIID